MLSPWCLQSKEDTVEDSDEGGNGGRALLTLVMAQVVVMVMGVVLVKV